jgi:Zn-dependent peptidase ImmA (M78 family)/transcriptional regulator with XRE-family HTH domain
MSGSTPGFIGQRLVEARRARGLSATDLAGVVGVSVQSVSKYENGHQTPTLETFHALARALNIPRDYFLRPVVVADNRPVFWRGKLSAPPVKRERAAIRLEWMKEVVDYLAGYFDFPSLNLPRIDVPDLEDIDTDFLRAVAAEVRRYWDIRPGPMPDVIEKLETNGTLVSRIHVGAEKLDAFSQWSDRFNLPFVVLSRDKASAVRQRFDALHELAHVILHRNVTFKRLNDRAAYAMVERQADQFAGFMLLPEKEFSEELYSASLDGFLALKERWGASVGAMIMRTRAMDILSEDGARSMWINYNRRGWRNGEPLDGKMEKEAPYMIRRSFEKLIEAKVQSVSDILAALPFPAADLEELADVEPGTLTGAVEARPEPVFKSPPGEAGNVVSIFSDKSR